MIERQLATSNAPRLKHCPQHRHGLRHIVDSVANLVSRSCQRCGLTLLVCFNLIALQLLAQQSIAETPAEATNENVLVAPGAELARLKGEYAFTEGPAVDDKGNVYFTDQPNDRIVKWSAVDGSVEDWLSPAGRANGTWMDRAGNLIVCADEENQLWSIAPDKSVKVLLRDNDGKLFNGPNDVWVRPQGGLYFTDPLYVRDYWKRDRATQQGGQHVFFLAKDAARPIKVADDLQQPNGIIGTPDGKTLYVADIRAGKTYAYEIRPDGTLAKKRLFCDQGSDGMTIDDRGNVYLTGRGVSVFDREGKKISQIDVPERWTANVTFGGKDFDLLFITASKGIYGIQMSVKGAVARTGTSSTEKSDAEPDSASRGRNGRRRRSVAEVVSDAILSQGDIDGDEKVSEDEFMKLAESWYSKLDVNGRVVLASRSSCRSNSCCLLTGLAPHRPDSRVATLVCSLRSILTAVARSKSVSSISGFTVVFTVGTRSGETSWILQTF